MSEVASAGGKGIPSLVKEIILDEKAIAARVKDLALEITSDYVDKDPVVVAILKGAFIFTCDLIRQISVDLTLDFIAISQYAQEPPGGEVRIVKDIEQDMR